MISWDLFAFCCIMWIVAGTLYFLETPCPRTPLVLVFKIFFAGPVAWVSVVAVLFIDLLDFLNWRTK